MEYRPDPSPEQMPVRDDAPGDSDYAVVQRVCDLVRECVSERQSAENGFINRERAWDMQTRRYLGDHWSEFYGMSVGGVAAWMNKGPNGEFTMSRSRRRIRRFTDNRTQNAIITTLANEMAEPPAVKVRAVESNTRDVVFLKAEAGFRLQDAGIDPAAYGCVPDQWWNPNPEDENEGAVMPLTTRQYNRMLDDPALTQERPVMGMTPDGQQVPTGQVLRPLIGHDDFWRVNDSLCEKLAQKILEIQLGRANAEIYMNDNTLAKLILGHSAMTVQWDAVRHQIILTNPHVLLVYPDPTASNPETMSYLVIDHLIDKDEAKKQFPRHVELIEKSGTTNPLMGAGYTTPATFADTRFQRDMMIIRVAWERNQMVPMTVDEAIRDGLVVEEEIKVWLADDGTEYDGEVLIVDDAPMSGDGRFLTEIGTRTRYLILETGEETFPDTDDQEASENWPTTTGILQTMILMSDPNGSGTVLQKSRCPYSDIPVGWNKNIAEPWSPYGQGEPLRLEDVQQLINRIWTVLQSHQAEYQFPMEIWPESLVNRMKNSGIANWSGPGRSIPLNDSLWVELARHGMNTGFYTTPPAPPAWSVSLLRLAMDEFDKLSGNSLILQGQMPSANASGRSIGMLQNNSRGVIGYKAMHSQFCFERVCRIALDAIIRWLPESHWRAVFGEIPWPVLSRAIEEMEFSKWNIQVEVYTGRGIVREQKIQDTLAKYAGGAPMRLASREQALEDLEVPNAQKELARIDAENQKMGLMPSQGAGQAMQQMAQNAAIQARGEALENRRAQQ